MKYIILFIFNLNLISVVYTQTTFNKRINFGFSAQLFTSVETDSSGIYCLGIIGDSISPYQDGSMLVKFNHKGQQEWFKMMTSVEKPISTYYNNMHWDKDKHLKYGGYYKENSKYQAILFKNDSLGNLLDSNSIYPFKNYPSDLMGVKSWVEFDDSEIIITSFRHGSISKIGLLKRTNGNVIKEVVIFDKYNLDNISILSYGPNKVLIGNSVIGTIIGDDIERINITAMDTSLIIAATVWESHPDSNWVRPADMIKAPDGGVIVAFKRGKYILAAQSVNYVPSLFKLTSDFKTVEWIRDIPTFNYSILNQSHKLLTDDENEYFYLCGEDFRHDSVLIGETILGFLAKFSYDGSMQWLRRYSNFEARRDYHHLYDMKRTYDKGFVLVGEATDKSDISDSPRQQAWLLKVDSFGCLVPGCQMVSPVQDVPPTSLDVRLFPNPVRDGQTAIYIGEQGPLGEAIIDLYDLQGRLLKSWPIHHQEPTTYLLDLPPVSTGMYILQVQAGQRMWTERVIVE